jgi:hypothetical protein
VQEELKTVTFNESGQIMLDGQPLEHVKSYRLEKYTHSNEPAELTLIMLVKVGRDNDCDLSEEEKREIEEDMEKRMNLQGIIESIIGFFVLVLIVLTIFFPY